MSGRARAVAAVVLGLALTMAGCSGSPSDDEVVDGWAVGQLVPDCTDRSDDPDCGPYLAPALTALGGAPAGSVVTLHSEGVYSGGRLASRGGGPVMVVVVTDAAGHRRAVGVGCGFVPDGQALTCGVVDPPFG